MTWVNFFTMAGSSRVHASPGKIIESYPVSEILIQQKHIISSFVHLLMG